MFKLKWEKGGEAELEQLEGDHVVLLSTIAAPPGAPLRGSDATRQFQVKVRGCRRASAEPLRYRIEGRFFNLSRGAREYLKAWATSAEPG